MKYYFKHSNSEICHNKQYFIDYMQKHKLTEIEVYEAIPDKIHGIFWCKEHQFCGDGTFNHCSKDICGTYTPRNGKNGCCKHFTTKLYVHGEKIKLKL